MFNLQDLMQRYYPQFQQGQFMQGQMGQQFGQPQQQPGYSQQTAGGYQPAQQMYQGTPAQIPQPGGFQGGQQQWNGGGMPSGGYTAGPAMRPQGPMQRYSLGSLMGRPNY